MNRGIILGSGTSNGIPMLGYRYPPGYLDNPKNHRTRCSLLIQSPLGNVLVDCPPEMRLQLTQVPINGLEAVFITHSHADHVMGMDDLRSLCILQDKSMDIFSLPEFHADIRRIYPYAFQEAPRGLFFPKFVLHEAPESIELIGLKFETFPVIHGSMRVLGIRFENVAYITDVSKIPISSRKYLERLDILIIDALQFKPHPNHFSLEEALAVVEEFKPKRTILTHLTHFYDHEETSKILPQNVELAFDGLNFAF